MNGKNSLIDKQVTVSLYYHFMGIRRLFQIYTFFNDKKPGYIFGTTIDLKVRHTNHNTTKTKIFKRLFNFQTIREIERMPFWQFKRV